MTAEMMKKRKCRLMLGMLAAVLMMLGDLIWRARGAGAIDTALGAFADKAWLDMSTWRFVVSNILFAAAVPLYYIGFTEMYHIIRDRARDKTDRILSKLFRVGMLAATMAFIFIHTLCVNMPLIMQGIAPYVSVEKAAEITNNIMMLNIVPTVAYFLVQSALCRRRRDDPRDAAVADEPDKLHGRSVRTSADHGCGNDHRHEG